ncbi:MAG: hypothetical protein IJO14_08335 [Clostridia bacterium]|nr:hypothetical protein [Clostridia bacterium]
MNINSFDDSDMKIAGAPAAVTETFDTLAFMEEAREQRFNGNMQRAKNLGSNIVSAFSYKAAPDEQVQLAAELGVELDDNCVQQIKLMSVFAAEYCLENYLPSASLSATAVNAMYDVLMETAPDFYRTVSASMAFSFYYLCVRKGGDIPAAIGKRFAMLCGRPDDEACAKLGTMLLNINTKVYRRAIDAYAFV